jgi:hypothetical protein
MAARKEKPIFKRLIAQQTTEHPRGSEDDYFDLLQRTMAVSPWIEYRGGNCPNISDQDIATASEFARELIQAKNFQEFAQIETAFIRRLLSRTDVAQETTETLQPRSKRLFWLPTVQHMPRLFDPVPHHRQDAARFFEYAP